MNKELTYSTPEEEGVSSEYIINFLNEMEKRRKFIVIPAFVLVFLGVMY